MKHTTAKGFSIIELIVSMSIFVILTALLLANYNSINRRLSLDTLVHQMAQWVRETQISAMGVKSRNGSYKQGYGLHFDQSNPSKFIYFADIPPGLASTGNKQYDATLPCGNSSAECIQEVTLERGAKINKICASVSGTPINSGTCPNTSGHDEQLQNVDIVFTRPDPDSEINGNILSGPLATFGHVVVYIKTENGYERSFGVWKTGQVTVQ